MHKTAQDYLNSKRATQDQDATDDSIVEQDHLERPTFPSISASPTQAGLDNLNAVDSGRVATGPDQKAPAARDQQPTRMGKVMDMIYANS